MHEKASVRLRHSLPFAWSDQTQLLADDTGQPVWPICDGVAHSVLQAFATAHGLVLVETEAKPAQVEIVSRSGLVVGLGLNNPQIAKLYAHLTGRRYANVETLIQLAALGDVAVVMLRTDTLDVRLFEHLYRQASKVAPGLIFASDEATLTLCGLRFAAALMPMPGAPVARGHVSVLRELGPGDQDWLVADSRSSAETLRQVLAQDIANLRLEGHSDGIHVPVPGGNMLCSVEFGVTNSLQHNAYCQARQTCTQFPHLGSLHSAWESGKLIGARDVKARVLFNDSCFAFRVVDEVVDPRFSFACTLAERGVVCAMVGIWQMGAAKDSLVDALISHLEQGEEIGRVIGGFNGMPQHQRLGRLLALLGDPAYCSVAARPLATKESRQVAAPTAQQMVDAGMISKMTVSTPEARFLHACILSGLVNNLYCDEEAGKAIIEGLSEEERQLLNHGSTRPAFRSLILRFFSSNPLLSMNWRGMAKSKYVPDNKRCPFCKSGTSTFAMLFDGYPERWTQTCPRCFEICDLPISLPSPTLQVVAGVDCRFVLDGLPTDASVMINLIARDMLQSQHHAWPADTDGTPLREWSLPLYAIPEGQSFCRVLFAWGMQVGALALRIQREGEQISLSARPI